MKYLNQFLRFLIDDFLREKSLVVTGTGEYTEYGTNRHLGTKVQVVIVRDDTPYQYKDGNTIGTNLYEKMSVKCLKDVELPIGAVVALKNARATVYGDRHNQLSVTCDDIVVIKGE